jgi:chromosome segregation ATPase
MKLIPSYQEFVYDLPLNGKISPELAENLAEDFKEIESLNEGFLDSIKNSLSKSFLGSLSYINMIDKAREMILKDQKDFLSKRYSHEDEIDSLRNSLKSSTDSVNSERIKKTISNKENEYKTYVNMLEKRIEKTEDAISKMIEGNKRRSDYYDAGKSQDELILAEFEYKLAKARAKSDPKEIKELESKVKDAKKEAEEAQEELKASAEKAKEKSTGNESINRKKKFSEQIREVEETIDSLEKEIKDLKIKKTQQNGKLEYLDKNSLESKVKSLKKAKEDLKKFKSNKTSQNKTSNPKTGLTYFKGGRKQESSIAASEKNKKK